MNRETLLPILGKLWHDGLIPEKGPLSVFARWDGRMRQFTVEKKGGLLQVRLSRFLFHRPVKIRPEELPGTGDLP